MKCEKSKNLSNVEAAGGKLYFGFTFCGININWLFNIDKRGPNFADSIFSF